MSKLNWVVTLASERRKAPESGHSLPFHALDKQEGFNPTQREKLAQFLERKESDLTTNLTILDCVNDIN